MFPEQILGTSESGAKASRCRASSPLWGGLAPPMRGRERRNWGGVNIRVSGSIFENFSPHHRVPPSAAPPPPPPPTTLRLSLRLSSKRESTAKRKVLRLSLIAKGTALVKEAVEGVTIAKAEGSLWNDPPAPQLPKGASLENTQLTRGKEKDQHRQCQVPLKFCSHRHHPACDQSQGLPKLLSVALSTADKVSCTSPS